MAMRLPAEIDSVESEDAASGTRIHAVLAGEADESTLSADEVQTADMCRLQEEVLIAEFLGACSEAGPVTIRERRLGLTIMGRVVDMTRQTKAKICFSGQADVIVLAGERALILDYKTGRGETADAVDNAQLASLAALVSIWQSKLKSVRVAIVQPWAGKPTVADYGAHDLLTVQGWLFDVLNAADAAGPEKLRAGDHCKYCRVGEAHRCPAVREVALQQVEVLAPETLASLPDDVQREAMFARAMELPAQELAESLRGLAMVKRFVAAIEGAAKMRAKDDAEFQRFFTLRQKQGRRSIVDVRKVFERVHGHGVSAEDFTGMCSIGLGDVKDLLRRATGAKGKALDALHSGVLESVTHTGAPSYELIESGKIIAANPAA